MQAEAPYRIVLSLGRLHPLKGLDLLVSAWSEVKRSALVHHCDNSKVKLETGVPESHTNELFIWKLVIAGPDEQGTKERLKVESEKLKLKWCESTGMEGCEGDEDVVFLGAVYDEAKWALMQSADIFVLPSRSENFGIVVGESLSCSVPVVTTAVGPWGEPASLESYAAPGEVRGQGSEVSGNARMLEWMRGEGGASDRSPVLMEKRGLIVVETSVTGIAEGLRRMMVLSDAERKEMGMRGCEWVKREFSWESVTKQMLKAYGVAEN
jgi:glycosyltransferase involved in cell wall biosynthesis